MIREIVLFAVRGAIILGLILVAARAALAQHAEVHCQPIMVPRCENALKTSLERGGVPNRCNVT